MNQAVHDNRLIALEGVDGSGKGVQSRRLAAAFEAAGEPTVLTREPGGSPAAERIRGLLVEGEPDQWDSMTELMLVYAARRAHLRDTIWPALEAGRWVVSDRFADSSRAFQGIAGGLGLELVDRVHEIVVGAFEPALVLILDLDERIALERAERRGDDENRFERKGPSYQADVRAAFLEIARRDPERYRVVDGNRDRDAISREIVALTNARFGLALEARTDVAR